MPISPKLKLDPNIIEIESSLDDSFEGLSLDGSVSDIFRGIDSDISLPSPKKNRTTLLASAPMDPVLIASTYQGVILDKTRYPFLEEAGPFLEDEFLTGRIGFSDGTCLF